MKLNIKRLREGAVIPTYGTDCSAGADLYACIDSALQLRSGDTQLIPTGLSVEIPDGYAGLVFARSGIATRQGLAPANKVGVIDSDYRGELMVSLHNHSTSSQQIEPGERIAQLMIVPYIQAEFCESDSLGATARGEGGFGSTGK